MSFTFVLRNGTTAQWAASSRVLRKGEPGFDTDLNIHKFGDGIRTWANLPISGAGTFVSQPELTGAVAAGIGIYAGNAPYSVSPAKSATANRAGLLAAATAAVAAGVPLYLPQTPLGVASPINIDGEILLDAHNGLSIVSPGLTVIRQTVKPETIFNVKSRVSFTGTLVGLGAGLDMTGMTTSINYARYCVIWLNSGSSGSRVSGVRGIGMHRAVRVDPDPTTVATPDTVPNLSDLVVDDVVSENCWVAVSAVGFNDLTLTRIRGNYLKAFASGGVDSTGQPPHLIYVIDRDTVGRSNFVLVTRDCLAWDSGIPVTTEDPGAAYAIKGVTGWTYDSLQARNCAGILDIINVSSVSAGTAVSVNDAYPVGGPRAAVAIKTATDITVRASVHSVGDRGRAAWIEGGTARVNLIIDVNASPVTAEAGSGMGFIRVSGNDNVLQAKIVNKGAARRAAVSLTSTASRRNRVESPRISGAFRYPVEILEGGGHQASYDGYRALPFDTAAGATPTSVYVDPAAPNAVVIDRTAGATIPTPAGYLATFEDGAIDTAYTRDGAAYVPVNGGTFKVDAGAGYFSSVNSGASERLVQTTSQDGTFRAVWSDVGDGQGGLTLRGKIPTSPAVTLQDYLRLRLSSSAGNKRPMIQSRIAGGTPTTLVSAAASDLLNNGDVIEVVLAGTSVIVYRVVGDFDTGVRAGTAWLTTTDPDATTDRVWSGPECVTVAGGVQIRLDALRKS